MTTLQRIRQMKAPKSDWTALVAPYLAAREARTPSESCPLPELYRAVAGASTVGEFHDGLRRLSRDGLVRLVEWTQPLRAMPEEQFALIAGGEVRYYARTH